jgi:hypothetical protein
MAALLTEVVGQAMALHYYKKPVVNVVLPLKIVTHLPTWPF